MIKIENLSVTYPDKTMALNNVSLEIEYGEKVALLGENGAGKTTLINSLVGIVEFEGRVVIGGIELNKKNLNEVRNKIGLVFQNPDDQLFMPTIYEDIAFGLRNMGMSEEDVNKRVDEYLSLINIERLKNKTSLKLSGGEKRMAALAAVLAMEPKAIICDEPTAFLDLKARRSLIRILKSIDKTQLIVTHDLTFALETCPRTVIIKNGEIFADGSTRRLLFDNRLMEECGLESIERF